MFSMAGVPPTVGFIAKLMILQTLLAAGFVWVAIFSVLFAVVGAYYYLRIVRVMYFERGDEAKTTPIAIPAVILLGLSINVVALLGFGLQPQELIAWCNKVFPLVLS